MIKRYCDSCGKEIVHRSPHEVTLDVRAVEVHEHNTRPITAYTLRLDLCVDCFVEIARNADTLETIIKKSIKK